MNAESLKCLYQRENWRLLLNELFGSNFKPFSQVDDLQVENQTAKSAVQLGEIHLASGDVLAVYEVELQDNIQVERNKVAIRNLLRTYWNKYDGAFIASYKENENVWRFSFVSETRQYDDEGNYGKVATAAKRFTYVLGQGESIKTATDRFKLLAATGRNTTLEDIKGAFNVEKMSKDFFDNYKKQYELFCEYMLSKTGIRQAIFNGDEKAIRDFNKKLLGRIVFLYFIQKKGWLGVQTDGNWGDGDINFLTNLFKKYEHSELFYSNILTVLFFDTLNKKRTDDLVELIKGEKYKIPFLNGGLFEEQNKKYREIIFPKEQFHNLFEFFNQYNFTIYEDDPNDHTVAVDPEMLGHIFENLLEDNKDKGAFYTPKEIVHYMCQESLIEYLCTTLQIEDEAKEREAITKLIKTKEIDDILKPEIKNINIALDKVKICDPAIGSGAFPMGLLHEIFAVKLTLYIFENKTSDGFDAAAVKLNIIQNSIYGVDIEPGAVDIARLRFWLSLIVDEPAPKALPNLDYKIVVGNSLVSKLDDDIIDIDWSLNDASHGLFATDLAKEKSDLLEKISYKQKLFFSSDCDKKKLSVDIRNLKIDLLINQLYLMNQKQNIPTKPSPENYLNKPKAKFTEDTAKYLQCLGRKDKIKKLEILKTKSDEILHFFDWKLDFPEIMNEQVAEKVGFDIVIGNPPYVDSENMIKNQPILRELINKTYESAKGNWDLFIPFHELAIKLLKDNSIKAFITPNKWLSIGYADVLRFNYTKYLCKICNCNGVKVFEAGVTPVISFFKKLVNTEIQVDSTNNRFEFINEAKIPSYLLNKDSLGILLSKSYKILLKIKKLDDKFKDYITCENPFSTSEAYQLCNILIDNKYNQNYYKFINTGTIDPFVSLWGRKTTTYLKSHYQNPIVLKDDFKRLFPRRIIQAESPKLVITGMRYLECFYDKNGEYIAGKSTIIIRDVKNDMFEFFSCFLNSKLISFYIKQSYSSLGIDGGVNFTKDIIEGIPIPKLSKIFITKINKAHTQIINYLDNDIQDISFEQQIDNLVYKLYELTYEEVKVVDPDFGLSEEEYKQIQVD